ncbi:MAG: hypothetical protein ACK5PF_02670 [bacterium]
MPHSDHRMVGAIDTPGDALAAGGAIRGTRCAAMAGRSSHGPMT